MFIVYSLPEPLVSHSTRLISCPKTATTSFSSLLSLHKFTSHKSRRICSFHKRYLGGMKSIVEDVEDERESECNPANCQCFKDNAGCDKMRMSLSVSHNDGLSRCGPYKGHHSQAE